VQTSILPPTSERPSGCTPKRKDISITGSPTLVRSLLQDGLLDELRLIVHPIVVGSGKHLFEEGGDQKALKLVDAKTFSTGVLYRTYQPAQG
jgi:dihydrofolate reductase